MMQGRAAWPMGLGGFGLRLRGFGGFGGFRGFRVLGGFRGFTAFKVRGVRGVRGARGLGGLELKVGILGFRAHPAWWLPRFTSTKATLLISAPSRYG